MTPITVLLADDHSIHRDGVKALLRSQPDIKVIAEAANGREAVELSKAHRPVVVVMDLQMPVMNGIEATRQVRGVLPDVKVLVLSSMAGNDAATVVAQAGAAAFVSKLAPPRSLPDVIREVVSGSGFIRLSAAATPASPREEPRLDRS